MKSIVEYINEAAKKQSYFYGIKPYRMIWHGEWADPEITDGKDTVSYYAVEDALYEFWKDEVKSSGQNDDDFDKWMKTDDAKSKTEEFFNIAAGYEA